MEITQNGTLRRGCMNIACSITMRPNCSFTTGNGNPVLRIAARIPHLHVSAALNAQTDALTRREIDLDKRHLPTGQVSLSTVIRALIADFDIAPQRQDWRETLDRAGASTP